ncbi:hypothetical protein [Pseudorhodoferax sp. Leaf267]|uniref:hypothetical protein n=1 Tax=Pseudorhodoferax sp. Leaf267 TaxID=1736316 RepID=UPI00138F7572|nr:hypothetical protein [Pseudorhodoferax sp. Leaf267]
MATAARAASRQPPGVADVARAQIGHAPPTPSEGFSRSVASAVIPDCLRDTPDAYGQPNEKQMQGLLAVPLIALMAAAGRCR